MEDAIKQLLLQSNSSNSSFVSPAPTILATPSNQPTYTPCRRLSLTSSTTDEMPYQIPEAVVRNIIPGCRSRRNLAGRLTGVLFTEEEQLTSNVRGVLNKNQLDPQKVDAIRRTCIGHFPPLQHETGPMIEREIREGVDEMCRRSARKARLGN